MNAGQWRDRIRKALRNVDEARTWQKRVDDNDAEERVKDATWDFWRALANQPPIPPEVREAQRRLDEFCEEHPYALDDDPILMERDQQLQQQVTDAECAAGIHTSCRHAVLGDKTKQLSSPPPDDGEVSGDWFAEQRATTWGVIQPDGTVVAKGFLGDDDAQEDMAVHPPGAIAVHGANGWVNAATGHPASEGPARRPDEGPPPTEPAPPAPQKTTPPTGGTNGSGGGAGMSITDARGGIMGAHQSAEQALNELMAARSSLEDSQNGLRQGTEGSNQAEAEQAHAQLAEALSMIDEAQQQVAQALQEFEGVANRL